MKHSESVIPSGNEIAGIWKQQVGAAKILWGKLTDDEILRTQGQTQKLVGIIQERYAISREIADQQVADFMAKIKL
ncbi:uncharacterized protein YjbJ (UPF0337 family) [Jezberella montanilacus]|jgi:uncharacterized protein YjbJ (UPF0337 family)|uniref:Uncharacterized protein YjbJ (UPF0337 family) n=1 Tax=Jezberella montanilacus TaxID=323426 RepID=A0A2T0XBK3_9BURK|nr:CsbD family protein [Jezberella montanilacus]PRY96330.1 uncharacterized protein YjbJ (UPF0337 family) [Jezberella montanilacus]|eukprot:gene10422-10490_t